MVSEVKPYRKLFITTNKNQALKDINSILVNVSDVISVSKTDVGLYNTKVVIEIKNKNPIDEGDRAKISTRTILYNRVDIEKIIPLDYLPRGDIENIIHELNTKHQCDFTEDDLIYTNGVLEATNNSLGYYGSKHFILPINDLKLICEADMSSVKLSWTNTIDGTTFTQEIEKKIGDGEFTTTYIVPTQVDGVPNSFEAVDEDITYNADTDVTYRIVTVSGVIRLTGNEVIITIPAMPTAVTDLSAVIVNG